MKHVMIVILLLNIAATAFALDDTAANRAKEAERYLKATPPEEMMKDLAEKMAMNMPPERRKEFRELMTKYLDMVAMTKLMKDSMVRHFTANELKALADFYGSPLGKSATKKFGAYLADAMPVIQAEILKAYGEAIKAQSEANRKIQDTDK